MSPEIHLLPRRQVGFFGARDQDKLATRSVLSPSSASRPRLRKQPKYMKRMDNQKDEGRLMITDQCQDQSSPNNMVSGSNQEEAMP